MCSSYTIRMNFFHTQLWSKFIHTRYTIHI